MANGGSDFATLSLGEKKRPSLRDLRSTTKQVESTLGVFGRPLNVFGAGYTLLHARMFRDMDGRFCRYKSGVTKSRLDLGHLRSKKQYQAGIVSPKNDDDE